MLDGQTIVIEDYLEIKPYNREKLFAALKSGKIICGPWYILPDELLISGESHIRNYLKGTEIVAGAGTKMETAYLPDSFGHPAQMPQIVEELRGKLGSLASFTGELRSGERSMLLGGTLSTRMYLKQKNDAVQNRMERYLEPVLAIEKLCGGKWDARGYQDYIRKKILENHPHDSICGCSIDEVHAEMVSRYECVERLENMLIQDAVVRCAYKKEEKQPERRTGLFLFG